MSAEIAGKLEAVLAKRNITAEDFLLELLEARFPVDPQEDRPVTPPPKKGTPPSSVLQEFRYNKGETLFGAITRMGDIGMQAARQLHNILTRYDEYKGHYPEVTEALFDVIDGRGIPDKLPQVPPTPKNLFEHLVIIAQRDQHHAAVKAAKD